MSQKKIILIEDEPDILEVIEYNLKRENFSVLTAADGLEGLDLVIKEKPDLVLLDLMLPGIDGMEICRQVRNNQAVKRVPIIMLTAKGDESDVVLGLGLGADDYMTKPFSPKELIARIKAVLRRSETQSQKGSENFIQVGQLVIDSVKHEVRISDVVIDLTPTEFKLLRFLASHPGRVFTRDQLLSKAIGEDVFVVDRNADVHIRMIRKKIGDYKDHILTIRGVGYRFLEY